jgi:hypothetical protein
VWFQISLFRSTVIIIDDGCCSSALVLWSLSTTTFYLSTTTSTTAISFSRFRWWWARTVMHLRLVLVSLVVAYLFIIFITFRLRVLIINGSAEFAHKKSRQKALTKYNSYILAGDIFVQSNLRKVPNCFLARKCNRTTPLKHKKAEIRNPATPRAPGPRFCPCVLSSPMDQLKKLFPT